MSLWMVRAGKYGEYEKKFLTDNRIYLTWDGFDYDLNKISQRDELHNILKKYYPNAQEKTVQNWVTQIWPFSKKIEIGDWVALPSKIKPAIHIAEIVSKYNFNADANDPYYHFREVKWIEQDIPRSNFGQDILYSLGAFMTVCQIKRNDAERRVRSMLTSNWKDVQKPEYDVNYVAGESDIEDNNSDLDLETASFDQIGKHIIKNFKGHGMAKLVEAILKAQGYYTYTSPEGPDHGVDILASPGTLGFGHPRICVQVKSGDSPIERPVIDQLIGTMQNFNAEQGLLVSWGGFRSSFEKEIPKQFFRVRLWNQTTLIQELLNVYDKLDDEIKAEIPLKRIWTIATPDE